MFRTWCGPLWRLVVWLLMLKTVCATAVLDSQELQVRQKREIESEQCSFGLAPNLETCSWSSSNITAIQWQLGSGTTANWLGGPQKDYANGGGSETGGYIFTDTSSNGVLQPNIVKRTAWLESPVNSRTAPDGTCLHFWYSINGLSADCLRVILVPDIAESRIGSLNQLVLWEARDPTLANPDSSAEGSSAGEWRHGQILYTHNQDHKIVFESVTKPSGDPASNYRGHIALDEIMMSSHENPTSDSACSGFCTFEGKLCGWENDADADFNWKQGRGSGSRLTGPARDHGSQVNGGNAGGYIYIDTSNPRRPGDKARLRSPTIDPKDHQPMCLRFFTHMYGTGIGTLSVILVVDGEETRIWQVSGDSGNQWHMGQVTVASPSTFEVILEGTVGRNAMGNIAIDDVTFRQGACPATPQTAVSRKADCTFENEECNWVNVNAPGQDQADWQRVSPVQNSGPAPTLPVVIRRMEPNVDHTRGVPQGFFMSMERGALPARNGDRAMLISPTFQASETACLSFWVALHERNVDSNGPGLGTLRVYVRPFNTPVMGPVGLPVWRLTNYEAPSWFNARVPIRYKDGPYSVVIEGTWGSTRQGAIAIDDVTVYDDTECSAKPELAGVSAGECSFDKDFCDWKVNNNNITSLQNQWQLATALRRPNNINDHTYQSLVGYSFFDVYNPQSPISVRLESPAVPPSEGSKKVTCLSFWFIPLGVTPETALKVIAGPVEDGQITEEEELWSVKLQDFKDQRSEWTYGQVAINLDVDFKVVFEGTSTNGGFAVDDINYYGEECSIRPGKAKRDGTQVRNNGGGPSRAEPRTHTRTEPRTQPQTTRPFLASSSRPTRAPSDRPPITFRTSSSRPSFRPTSTARPTLPDDENSVETTRSYPIRPSSMRPSPRITRSALISSTQPTPTDDSSVETSTSGVTVRPSSFRPTPRVTGSPFSSSTQSATEMDNPGEDVDE